MNFNISSEVKNDLEETKIIEDFDEQNDDKVDINISTYLRDVNMKEINKSDLKVLLPKCICLLSLHPVFKQMKNTLKSIIDIAHKNPKLLKYMLPYIIYEIPRPLNHSTLIFRSNKK